MVFALALSALKPGNGPGSKNGYWLNFGSGWSHLANDDFAQILTGAAPRLFLDAGVVAPVPGASGGSRRAFAASKWLRPRRRDGGNYTGPLEFGD